MQQFEYAENEQLIELKKSIFTFCQRPNGMGGVMLIAGPRGVGKTRLVDESLNDRQANKKRNCLERLFGEDKYQCRKTIKDVQPRGLDRTIIAIDVEPYFPHSHVARKNTSLPAKDKHKKMNAIETEVATFQLIRNIIFALTSNLDPRVSLRKHGKTLSAKLGLGTYWFSQHAMLPKLSMVSRIVYYCFLLVFVVFTLNFSASYLVFSNDYFVIGGLATLFTLFLLIIPYIFLRWRDWCALEKISSLLYDLVHAQDIKKSGETSHELQSKMRNLWIIPLLLFFAAISFELSMLKGILTNYKPLVQGGFLAGALITSLNITRKHKLQTEFNQDNPIWMLTLLKRYLFMLHRCAIEPVLVFDELDKLEDDEELQCFLDVLLRLKHTLGSDITIILIGNFNLYRQLQKDRHNRSMTLGKLATLIQKDIVLGPMQYEIAAKMLSNSGEKDEDRNKTYWLRSHGNFSTLIRTLDYQKAVFDRQEEKVSAGMADIVNQLWSTKLQKALLPGDVLPTQFKFASEWVQTWIHSGMLNLANRFLTDNAIIAKDLDEVLTKKLYAEHEDKHNIIYDPFAEGQQALIDSDPELLMLLGEFVLFRFLQSKQVFIHEGLFIRLNEKKL